MKKPRIKMNFLDRTIAAFSPAAGLRRAVTRTQLEYMAGPVTKTSASTKGTLGNWFGKRVNRFAEERERVITTDRAADLVANNGHATSIIESTALNVVGGAGLTPQSRPNFKRLGITEEQANDIADQAEYAFTEWSKQADAEGESHFSDLQYQTIYSLLMNGESLTLPVQMEVGANRTYSFALQLLDNRRLRTPRNLISDPNIRDGIKLGNHCERLSYFIANPDDGKLTTNLSSNVFEEIPAWRGHRRNVYHVFHKKSAEQVRGVSILSPVVKLFRDYDDYMDFELVGAILAASFPVFIETPPGEDPIEYTGDSVPDGNAPGAKRITEVTPGTITYGTQGQVPHVMQSTRPGNSFPVFVETLLRAIGAATGLPYEVVAKDFSKTNYSSARAAMLEAYRIFQLYQSILINHHNQPIWDAVFEEAWLRGQIVLPAGAPDFYQARAAYTNCCWTPPKRGTIDPVKEVAAGKEAIISNMLTLADWYAEQGKDYEEELRQISRERKLMKKLDLTMADMPGFDLAKMATQPEAP